MPSFDFSDQGRRAFTDRNLNQARSNSLFYNFGNRASESLLETNERYSIPNPSTTVFHGQRDRAANGALADFHDYDTDSASLTWLDVTLTGNHNVGFQIDQRDVRGGRIVPDIMRRLRADMVDEMRLWIDRHVITQLLTASTTELVTTASTDTSNALYDISSRRIAGNAAQRKALAQQLIAWMEDAIFDLGEKDFRPGVGIGQQLAGAFVGTVHHHKLIEDYLLDEYGNTDLIVLEQLRNEAAVFGGTYRGSWKGVLPIFSTAARTVNQTVDDDGTSTTQVQRGLTPIAAWANTNAGTQANLLRAFIFVPNNTWDNAVVSYPAQIDGPDAKSAKYVGRQEIEAAVKVINGNDRGEFKQFTIRAQA